MTTLPEEAVKAADIIQVITNLRLAILQDDDEGLAEHAEPMVKAKELIAKLSASPFLPVQGAVKKLEWVDADEGMCTKWRAAALGGHYELVDFGKDDPGFAVNFHWGRPLSFWFIQGDPDEWGPTGPKIFPTLEAAKAAAQADYEARILSAIEPAPSAARDLALDDKTRLDAATAALISLTEAGIPTDVQELLIVGDPSRGIAPGSLSKAIATVIRALSSPDHSDAGKVEGDGIERAKFYHHQWPMKRLLGARRDGLVDHSGGEAWRYEYSHKDEHGKYDILYRPVKNSTIPARLPSTPASEGAE